MAQTALVSKPPTLPSRLALLLRGPGASAPLISVCFDGQEIVAGVPTQTYGPATVPFSLTATGQVGFHAAINSTVSGDNALVFADANQLLQIIARKTRMPRGPGTTSI